MLSTANETMKETWMKPTVFLLWLIMIVWMNKGTIVTNAPFLTRDRQRLTLLALSLSTEPDYSPVASHQNSQLLLLQLLKMIKWAHSPAEKQVQQLKSRSDRCHRKTRKGVYSTAKKMTLQQLLMQ
jgi:hypothetical protein